MILNVYQALIFGAVQGVTELFPISSLGHSVILPKLLGWSVNQKDPFFLTFLVATHAATATVLFLFFLNDWKKIIAGFSRSFKDRQIKESDTYAKLAWLLIIATIPAGILGLLFEQQLKNLFASPQLVALVLVLNGILLLAAEYLRRRKKSEATNSSDQRIAKITWIQTVKVGAMQALALFPGLSRTGSAMTGGLLVGLHHEDAARFSFLLATPIIGAAALLKLPELTGGGDFVVPCVLGAISSAIFAYLSVRFLTKYFQTKTLTPFGIYCLVVGSLTTLLFLFR